MFSGSLGLASLGEFLLGEVDSGARFTYSGSTTLSFTGLTTPVHIDPEIYFSSQLGLITLGQFELGQIIGKISFRVEGHTDLAYNVPNPVPAFQSNGSTTVNFIVFPSGTIFQSDGHTTVSFIGRGANHVTMVGSTTVLFHGASGGRFRSDGHTDIVFYVPNGQSVTCITGDGIIQGIFGEENFVF